MDTLSKDMAAAFRRIEGEGTPDVQWQAWDGLAALTPVTARALVPEGARAVIVAPHPDDELLGCGGLMQLLADDEREMLLVAVTDGDASHPDSPAWPAERLARERPRETGAALAALGLPELPVVRLGLPDGAVGSQVAVLRQALEKLLRPGDVVITTWKLDGHPDHEATGHAAGAAAGRVGATLLQMPIWTWHWAQPDEKLVPWHRARRLVLDGDILERKRAAVACYRSQTEPDEATGKDAVLPPYALARLLHPYEIFLTDGSVLSALS
jgi:LmbE family N-acetylglucosaminyl deacetylase